MEEKPIELRLIGRHVVIPPWGLYGEIHGVVKETKWSETHGWQARVRYTKQFGEEWYDLAEVVSWVW